MKNVKALVSVMKIKVSVTDTIFGDIVREFTDYYEAMKWVEICLWNDLKVVITGERND
jgi:hypothetical protein